MRLLLFFGIGDFIMIYTMTEEEKEKGEGVLTPYREKYRQRIGMRLYRLMESKGQKETHREGGWKRRYVPERGSWQRTRTRGTRTVRLGMR